MKVTIRDRIKEFRRVPANELLVNPKNWRTHGKEQKAAMRSLLEEVGFAGAALARELDDGSLMLIDGHLRTKSFSGDIPVLVLDVTEAEADKILATFDPISAMAGVNSDKLNSLIEECNIGNKEILKILNDMPGVSENVVENMQYIPDDGEHSSRQHEKKQSVYPLSINLTKIDIERWKRLKESLRTNCDTKCLLMLIENHD